MSGGRFHAHPASKKELLLLIRDRMAEEGVPPSFDEMKEALGLRSKSGIHRLITGLEERGFIKRLAHRARALEIIRLPEGIEPPKTAKASARKTRLPSNMPDMAAIAAAQSIRLPLYGRIAAGSPIEAMRDADAKIDVPIGLIAGARGKIDAEDHYAAGSRRRFDDRSRHHGWRPRHHQEMRYGRERRRHCRGPYPAARMKAKTK